MFDNTRNEIVNLMDMMRDQYQGIIEEQKKRILELYAQKACQKMNFDLSFHGKIMGDQAKRIEELEKRIETFRNAVEKLEADNETLRKLNEESVQNGHWAQRWSEEVSINKSLEARINELQEQIDRQQQTILGGSATGELRLLRIEVLEKEIKQLKVEKEHLNKLLCVMYPLYIVKTP